MNSKQLKNLYHILFIFPLIYMAVYQQEINPEVFKRILLFTMVAGLAYHTYAFIAENEME